MQVLNGMKTPHPIEPHQIQGLNYINIFPVVQWLVKKAIETRQIEGDKVRKFAVKQYEKEHISEEDIQEIEDKSKTSRIYKVKEGQDTTVDLTLLEYGQVKSRSSKKGSDEKSVIQNVEKETISQEAKNFVDVQSLSKAAEKYAILKENAELENNPATLLDLIKMMEDKKESITTKLNSVQAESADFEPRLNLAQKRTDKMVSDLDELDGKIAEQELSPQKEELLAKLQKLVSKNELLKQKEAEYKEQCRDEMEELLQENQRLEQELKLLKDSEEITDDETDQKLLEKLTKKLTNINDQIETMERQVDAVPSRYELAQYQKRFVELDHQVSAEYCETQKFVIMYNSLRDQMLFMEKEIKLLNSIYDGIPDAKLSSLAAKQQFIAQLKQIHFSVHQSKSNVEKSLLEQQSKQDFATEELNQLMEQQRLYSILVRDMTEEMKKYEVLLK